MSSSNLAWFKFYPTDWLGAGTLRRADHAVKGFYIDLLCVMFDCEFPGRLETNGEAWTDEEIARSVNGDPSENLRHLHKLIDLQVLSRDANKTIFSRRMVKDENKRRACSSAGKSGGGNPQLAKSNAGSTTYKGDCKGVSKGSSKQNKPPETRDQRPETRSQIPDTTDQSEEVESASDSAPSEDAAELIVSEWNKIPGVTKAERITAKRKASLNARMREAYFRSNWQEGIARVALSEFCQGSRNWRADIDWFLRPDTLVKILEGAYDNRQRGSPATAQKNLYGPSPGANIVKELPREQSTKTSTSGSGESDAGRDVPVDAGTDREAGP